MMAESEQVVVLESEQVETKLEDVDQTCPICTDILTCPVKIQKIFNCEEKCRNIHRYCLTCLRDSLNLNGHNNGAGQNPLTDCPFCRSGFNYNFYNKRRAGGLNWADYYEVDEDLIILLDEQHGNTECPRDCDWTGLRKDVRQHLRTCPNSFAHRCKNQYCNKLFTLRGLDDHVNGSYMENRTCYSAYKNLQCSCGHFKIAPNHLSVCINYIECKVCKERVLKEDYTDHYIECSQEKILSLENQVNDLSKRLEQLEAKT